MYDYAGQTALITGASGGIGSRCAEMLHSFGAKVVITGTNELKLNELADKLGSNVEVKVCDLSDHSMSENLINELPQLEILVCNAGITKDNLAMRMTNEEFMDVINVNLMSSFVLNRSAIKKMIRNRYGRIINISSVVGVSGNPGQANYCASKAGLIGMTKSIAQEVASRNITVNCIAPGFITTSMTDKLTEEQKNIISDKIPSKKFGSTCDIAHGVSFLASQQSGYITGQTLHINGGMLMV